ncbi:MAG: winged helix-turn-helix transcriptional regulator [Chitinophagales bacterium]|nr:winged helix-turn-helix transcriptional regulator [Chitinophagales bacterium]
MTNKRDVFRAISDPTRREIINLLFRQPLNLNAISGNFKVSRPAISKHIKILSECGLVVIRQQGRERHCEARLNELNKVSKWVEQYRSFWTNKMDALEQHLSRPNKISKHKPKKIKYERQSHRNRKSI